MTPVLFIPSNAAIYERPSAGIMPCDERWPGAQAVNRFRTWTDKLLDDASSARHALNVPLHRDGTPRPDLLGDCPTACVTGVI